MLFGFAVIAQAFAALGFAATLVQLVDKGVDERTVPLDAFASAALVSALGVFAASFGTAYLVRKLSFEVEYDLRCWLYDKLHQFDLVSASGLTSGQVVTRSMADLTLVQNVIAIIPVFVAIAPVVLLGGLYLSVLSPLMGAAALGALVVNLLVVRHIGPRLHALSLAELTERGEITAAIDEPVRGIRVVHAFAAEPWEAKRLEEVAHRTFRFALARARLIARFDLIIKGVPLITYAFVLFLGARLVASDSLTLGTFSLAFTIVAGVARFAVTFDNLASVWQYFVAAQHRLLEILTFDRPVPIDALPSSTDGLSLERLRIEINGAVVLDDVTFSLTAGQLAVVHGAPRSGKSVLAATIAGLVAPSSGLAEIGGIATHLLHPRTSGSVVRVVGEEPLLFSGTIRTNLELGAASASASASEHQIQQALRAAAAEDIVGERSEGLDSPVGERGLDLSGGQRQRLALARALVAPPKVLVLDDALSAVQPALEHEIVQRIRASFPDMAVLFLTRRPGPAEVADLTLELPAPVWPAPVSDAVPTLPTNLEPAALEVILTTARAAERSTDDPEAFGRAVPTTTPSVFDAFVGPFRRLIALALVALAVQAAGQVAPSLMLGSVTDLARDHDLRAIDSRVVALLVIAVTSALSALAFQLLSQRYTHSVLYWLRRQIFGKLLRLGNDYYDRELPGQTATRVVNDIDTLTTFLSTAGFSLVVNLAQVAAAATALLILDLSFVWSLLAGLACAAMLTAGQAVLGARALASARVALGNTSAAFEEDLLGTMELRNLGALDRRTHQFRDHAWTLRTARRKVAYVLAAFGAAIPFVGDIVVLGLVLQAGNQVITGATTVGTVLAVRLLADVATSPLGPLSFVFGQFLDARTSWRQLLRPFGAPELPVQHPDAVAFDVAVSSGIEFQRVTFTYPGTTNQVLRDVDVTIAHGEFVAVVGPTGAGKSSIIKLVNRTYDPDVGRVIVGGRDVRDWTVASLRTSIGVVPQDAFVFRGSVADNIAYGQPDATADDVVAAAHAVAALDSLLQLPDGLDYQIAEAGSNLAAAQRQLIALARAWMSRPKVLILDEATSALDAAQERAVLQALRELDTTILTVTHRESVALAAARVLHVRQGTIAWDGTPDELTDDVLSFELFGTSANHMTPAAGPKKPAGDLRTAGPFAAL